MVRTAGPKSCPDIFRVQRIRVGSEFFRSGGLAAAMAHSPRHWLRDIAERNSAAWRLGIRPAVDMYSRNCLPDAARGFRRIGDTGGFPEIGRQESVDFLPRRVSRDDKRAASSADVECSFRVTLHSRPLVG